MNDLSLTNQLPEN